MGLGVSLLGFRGLGLSVVGFRTGFLPGIPKVQELILTGASILRNSMIYIYIYMYIYICIYIYIYIYIRIIYTYMCIYTYIYRANIVITQLYKYTKTFSANQ